MDAEPKETSVAKPTAAPGLTVVYHQYSDRAPTVDTPAGPVRVDAEILDRIADVAQSVPLTAEDVAEAEPLPAGAGGSRVSDVSMSVSGPRCRGAADRRHGRCRSGVPDGTVLELCSGIRHLR